MSHRFRLPISLAFALVCLFHLAGGPLVEAGTFNRTKVMDVKYAWGTSSLAEFDFYDTMYPGYLPVAILTLYSDGTFDAFDTMSGASGGGIYDKRGGNIEITIVPDGPYGTVQYIGSKVGPKKFAGEIKVNGVTWGHWRGQIQ